MLGSLHSTTEKWQANARMENEMGWLLPKSAPPKPTLRCRRPLSHSLYWENVVVQLPGIKRHSSCTMKCSVIDADVDFNSTLGTP